MRGNYFVFYPCAGEKFHQQKSLCFLEMLLFPLSYVPMEALVWNENGEDKGCNLNLHKRVNLKYKRFTNQ